MRSRILRVLKYISIFVLALLLVILIGGYFFVQSSYFDAWVREQIVTQLESRFSVRAHLKSIDVQLFGATVELEELRLFNARYPATQPAIEVGKLNLNFTVLGFLSPKVTMDGIRLVRPKLNLLRDPNDKLNLSNMFGSEDEEPESDEEKPPFSPVNLAIGEIEIVQGTFTYNNQTILFDSSSDGLRVEMEFHRPQRAYNGNVEVRNFDMLIDDFRVPLSNLDADFVLFEERVELPTVRLWGGPVEGTLSGEISNLSDFTYNFSVDLTADLARLENPDLSDFVEEGQVQTAGQVQGQGGEVHYAGNISSREVRVKRIPFRRIDGKIEVDREKVSFSEVSLNLFNGRAVSNGELTWEGGKVSFADVTARDIRIIEILRYSQVESLPLSGLVDSTMRFEWPSIEFEKISGSGTTEYLGRIEGLTQEFPEFPIQFTGHSRVDFHDNTFTFSEGVIDMEQNRIDYGITVKTDGSLTLSGTVDSDAPEQLIAIGLTFDLIPLDVLDEYPVRPRTSLQADIELQRTESGKISLDSRLSTAALFLGEELLGSLGVTLHLDPGQIDLSRLELQAEDYSISGSVRIARVEGIEPSLAVSLELDQLPVQKLNALMPEPMPVQGFISGEVDFTRREERYSGNGALSLSQLELYGEEIPSIHSEISFSGQQISLRNISASALEGEVRGSFLYNLEENRFEVDLSGEELILSASKHVRELLGIDGRVNFDLEGRGPISNPDLKLTLSVPNLALRDHTIQEFKISGEANGEQGNFQASGHFADQPFNLDGSLEFQSPYPFDASLELDETPLISYLEYFLGESSEEIEGWLSGRIEVTGNLESPEELMVKGDFQHARFDVQGYPVRTRNPFQLIYRNETLEIPGIELAGEKTDFSVEGSLVVGDPGSVDLKVSGQLNLQAVNGLIERGSTLGVLELETDIVGTLDSPRVVGSAQLIDGFFSSPELPITLDQAQGSFQFTADQVSINNLTTQTEHGQLSFTGGVFLDKMVPVRWQINAFGYGLRFEYPENVFSTLDVDIDLVKSGDSQLISGAVYIRGSEYTQDVAVADLIFRYVQSKAAGPPIASEDEITLDIDVEAFRSLRIDNNLADLTASGDFSIIGTLENPVVLGSLTIDEGTLRLEGNQYEITRGTVSFNNPRRTAPYLNFQAETEVREFTIEILIRGQVENLQVSFRSDPPLDTASVVSLLAAGQTQEEIFGSETVGGQTQSRTLALYGAGALLSKTLGRAIESQTSRLFGFERFSVDPFLDSSRDRDPGARITLGKQITRELGITYISNLGGELQDQTVIVQYRLTDWLTLVGTSQSDGTIAIDFKLRKRF